MEKPSIGVFFVMLIAFRVWLFRPDLADANFMTVWGGNALLIFPWLAPSIDVMKRTDWGLRVADQTDFRAVVSYVVGRLKTELQPYVSMFRSSSSVVKHSRISAVSV